MTKTNLDSPRGFLRWMLNGIDETLNETYFNELFGFFLIEELVFANDTDQTFRSSLASCI